MSLIDLNARPTQAIFGQIVGISQPAVSVLQKRGTLPKGGTLGAWIEAYCANLREQAAGRQSEVGGLDIVQEGAALKREQRIRLELQNAVTRGEYAPIELLGDALAKSIEVMVAELDQIDGLIAQLAPDAPEALRLAILSCVTTARNKIAARGASLVIAALDPSDDIGADLDDLDA